MQGYQGEQMQVFSGIASLISSTINICIKAEKKHAKGICTVMKLHKLLHEM